MTPIQKNMRDTAGFTLVELAIVMIIIGLLIAGVLKGQELIGNARVTATVAQLKSIDAAVSTFKDTYQGLPGDIIGTIRLPNCAAVPCASASANGDGQLATTPAQAPTVEATAFFPQLAAANLLTGIVPTSGSTAIGANFPAAKIDGVGIQPGSSLSPTTDLTGAIAATGTNSGLFLALVPTIANVTAASVSMKPKDASRIDAKIDDGIPGTGDVVAIGAIGNTANAGCGTAATSAGVYNTVSASSTCSLYVHIQG